MSDRALLLDARDKLRRALEWIDVDETAGEGPLVLVREIHALLARLDAGTDEPCACGHAWRFHARAANGAHACRIFGCGCRDVVLPAWAT